MEKNQWRLARILNTHKTKDGEHDSASIRLPSGSVVTRSVKQLALLEPCAIELERQWQEQKSVQCLDPEVPLTRGVRRVEVTRRWCGRPQRLADLVLQYDPTCRHTHLNRKTRNPEKRAPRPLIRSPPHQKLPKLRQNQATVPDG